LNNFNSSQRPDDAGRRAGLVRLVRRICLLREQGEAAEAGRLQENDLAAAVGEIRRADGADALREEDLVALFAAEAGRVSEALFTAELLIRRLTEIWPASPSPVAATARAPTTIVAPADARPAPAGPPLISDLLDAMLAAERPRTRLTPALNR
jgi:hypothetical protein